MSNNVIHYAARVKKNYLITRGEDSIFKKTAWFVSLAELRNRSNGVVEELLFS